MNDDDTLTIPGALDRRTVLKLTGSAVAVGGVATGGASAHPPREIRFCGCSQVCVDNAGENYRVIYATETEDGYDCRIEPSIDAVAETDPDCYEYTPPDEKIIGVLGGSRHVYWNPNNCARRALDDLTGGEDSLADCDGCTDGGCTNLVEYTQQSRHEFHVDGSNVVVRTRKCKHPDDWGSEDDRGEQPGPGPDDRGPVGGWERLLER